MNIFSAHLVPNPDRQKAQDKREAELTEREKTLEHEANVAFADKVVAEGKLVPGSKDNLISNLDALPRGESICFAEGEAKTSAREALAKVFAAQPKLVELGEQDLGEPATEDDEVTTFAEAISTEIKRAGELGEVISAAEAAQRLKL